MYNFKEDLKTLGRFVDCLLEDKTTGESITLNGEHIDSQMCSGFVPRVQKAAIEQKQRTKKKAEVFTPSWVCNKMNNNADEVWFNRADVFNVEYNNSREWKRTCGNIVMPDGKSWRDYVLSTRLEITCGEAPFLVSRYDTSTGNDIALKDRIGMLDRKLRVVNENASSYNEWIEWSMKAFQSTYGYEYQGDNLFIARVNMLMTYIEYHVDRWGYEPCNELLQDIINVICWNIWQMDGLTNKIPDTDCMACIIDWQSCETIVFNDMVANSESKRCSGKRKKK